MTTTILVADDGAYIVAVVAMLLNGEGYRVVCARDGLEALALTEQDRQALPLSDVMLPTATVSNCSAGCLLATMGPHRRSSSSPP